MKNQVIRLEDKNKKVFAYTDNECIISSKGHSEMDTLLQSKEKSGLLESIKTIPIAGINEIQFNENDESFTLKYDRNGKTKKEHIPLSDVNQRESIVADLASLKGFQRSEIDESKTKPLLFNIGGAAFVCLLTFAFSSIARGAQNGEHYVATGRRSGSKQLVANLAETIGPTGVLLIGAAGLAYMLYRTYKRYNNPATEVSYK